jgi:SAM-dependent methyltransferase
MTRSGDYLPMSGGATLGPDSDSVDRSESNAFMLDELSPARRSTHRARHVAEAQALFLDATRPVVDLGCGQTLFAEVSRRYVGLDPDAQNLRAASSLGRPLVLADARATPFRDESCGGVLCINVLINIAEPVRVLHEIHRILAPGASAYIKADLTCKGFRGRRLKWLRDLGRRFVFALHPVLHEQDVIHTLRLRSGATAICERCFRRYFTARGCSFRTVRRHLYVVTKEPAAQQLHADTRAVAVRVGVHAG